MKRSFKFHKIKTGKRPEPNAVVLLTYIPDVFKGARTTISARYIGEDDDGLYFSELGRLGRLQGDFLAFAYIDPVLPIQRLEALRLRYWFDFTDWQRLSFDLLALALVILSFQTSSFVLYVISIFIYLIYNKFKSYE